MSNFVELIRLGSDPNENIRQEHQQKLLDMREGYTEEFFKSCAETVMSGSGDNFIINTVFTVLINSLKHKPVNFTFPNHLTNHDRMMAQRFSGKHALRTQRWNCRKVH